MLTLLKSLNPSTLYPKLLGQLLKQTNPKLNPKPQALYPGLLSGGIHRRRGASELAGAHLRPALQPRGTFLKLRLGW